MASQVAGTDYDWKLKRDKSGIKIFTSTVPESPFKAVRGEMIIEAEIAELVALVNDYQRCAEWAEMCVKSELLKSVSNAEQYVYIYNNVPFPIKDRDVVAQINWSRNHATDRVSMRSIALGPEKSKSFREPSRKAIRIYYAVTQWHFTPIDQGRVRVENFAHVDPNGPTPAWLINLLLVNSPYRTMKNMRKLIATGDYKGSELNF